MSALLALFLILAGPPPPSPAQAEPAVVCPPSAAEKERLLSLPLRNFDQAHNEGWRPYGYADCHIIAADLIDGYIQRHAPPPKDETTLRWHQAQMLANAERRAAALKAMQRVVLLDDQRKAEPGWRLYVAGSMAFLRGDRPALAEAVSELDAHARTQTGLGQLGAMLNLNTLRGLERCFGKPYRQAYGAPCADAAESNRLNRLLFNQPAMKSPQPKAPEGAAPQALSPAPPHPAPPPPPRPPR